MGKLFALLDVFRKGSACADPELRKKQGMLAAALVAFLLAADRAGVLFGYPAHLTQTDAEAIGVGLAAIYHVLFTAGTSDKVGLPTVDKSGTGGGGEPAGDSESARGFNNWTEHNG